MSSQYIHGVEKPCCECPRQHQKAEAAPLQLQAGPSTCTTPGEFLILDNQTRMACCLALSRHQAALQPVLIPPSLPIAVHPSSSSPVHAAACHEAEQQY